MVRESHHTPQEPPDWVLEKIRDQFSYFPNRKRNAVKRVSHKGVGYGYPDRNGYIRFGIGRKREDYRVYAHHIAWYLYKHEWPMQSLDHINGDILDNRVSNLRYASQGQNMANRKNANKNNTSGYPCVYWHKRDKTWRVQIMKDWKAHCFGNFTDFEKAVEVAKRERKRLFGRFDPQH